MKRREFLQSTAAAATALSIERGAHAAGGEVLKIGLIGCGGRGTGAAAQALQADKNVKLTAMGDAFADRLQASLATLKKDSELTAKIDVKDDHCFARLDAYKQVIDSGVDVVLLTAPPGFRPQHLQYAVEKNKHIFAEKPVAVDGPGVRAVLASCEEAKKRSLSVVSGLCLRFDAGFIEAVKRLHDGALGDITTLQANDLRGRIWVKPKQPDWSEMTYQVRNWYHFTWLSGDFNVEQHVHYLDVCAWIMKNSYPVKAVGLGGRQARTGPEYGNIYDHHSVIYEFANGVKLFSQCRQQPGCKNDISAYVTGTKGSGIVNEGRLVLTGANDWTYRGKHKNMYQVEHDELFAGIRAGKPINNGEYMAHSTLMAIMGRMATYTGQQITWEQALGSKEDLWPKRLAWDAEPPPAPIAVPGQTKFI